MIPAPCKDCEFRHIGCHAECEPYRLYNEERERIRAERKKNFDIDDYEGRAGRYKKARTIYGQSNRRYDE